tara:strand:+ start:3701 stop:3991 length:291 start_codon:yes stop_codon:yes gene_type:complete
MDEKENDLGQMIYVVKLKVGYKVKRGNGYINNYRTIEFPTRMKSIEDINSNPEMIMNIMASLKLVGKKVYDFHVTEELFREELSRSFAYKEKDYLK